MALDPGRSSGIYAGWGHETFGGAADNLRAIEALDRGAPVVDSSLNGEGMNTWMLD